MPSLPLNPFALERRTLRTRLSPEECAQRIKESKDSWTKVWFTGTNPDSEGYIRGRVNPTGFLLYVEDFRSKTYYPVARGSFAPGVDRTEVRVAFGIRPVTVAGATACSLLLPSASIFNIAGNGIVTIWTALGFVAAPVVAAIFYGIGALNTNEISRQSDYILEFLRENLNADLLPAE
jgi:hypothetical protein